jgi:hypothetical protein
MRHKADTSVAPPAELRAHYLVDDHEIIYNATIHLVTNEKNQDEITHADEYWLVPSLAGRRKKIGVRSWLFNEFPKEKVAGSSWATAGRREHFSRWLKEREVIPETLDLLEKIVAFVNKFTYYSASQFTSPGTAPVSFEVEEAAKRRIGISINDHKRLLYDLYQEYLNKSKTFEEFMSVVGPEGIRLIDSIEFDEIQTSSSNYSVRTGGKVEMKERTNSLVVPRIQIAGNTLSPNQLSEGTFKTFALIFYLVTDESSVLMIEEPEVCVHHGLLNSIVELIKIYSADKQVIVSTHSDAVLDKVGIDNVFRVSRSAERGTIVSGIKKKMSSSEISALKRYLNNEGSLGEYWKHGDLETI